MKVSLNELRLAIESSTSMTQAATKLGIQFGTLKKYAIANDLYETNQGGRGTSKNRHYKSTLADILSGKHPEYQSYKLKHRLYKEGIKKNECEECGISGWNGKSLECELDHINGISHDHILSNLRILCPNCHSQTDTFRFKRGKE